MTSLLRRTSADPSSTRAAARRPIAAVRRRWGRIGVGVAAAVVGGWVFAALYLSADDRVGVVVAATDVERFEVLERADLRIVEVSADAAVEWVHADRLDDLVGRTVASGLVAGVPLVDALLVPDGERLVAASEAVVGVVVGAAEGPHGELRPGAVVSVVARTGSGGTEVVETPGWVLDVSSVSASGDRSVEVVVPRPQAGAVAAAAAERRVSLVAVGEG